MVRVFLPYHQTYKKGAGHLGFIITDEQWEHVNRWPKPGDEEFAVPKGLWPFIILHLREILELDEHEPSPLLKRTLWRPNDPDLIPVGVPDVDLSRLPIEVWHPDAPPVSEWPFPHPPVLKPP